MPTDYHTQDRVVGWCLKRECVGAQVFTDLTEAKAVLFDYIEVFYNRQRLHSTLNYLSPVQYEQQQLIT